jgi:hypothetical protein
MAETNGNPANETPSGWYQHKETGAVVELINDPELGTPLTNAYTQAGFVYVGEEDPRRVKQAPATKATKAKE